MPETKERRQRLSKEERRKRKNAKIEAARRSIRAQRTPANPRLPPEAKAGLFQCDEAGRIVRLPPASVARLVSRLLDGISTVGTSRYALEPDAKVLRSLIFSCWERTGLFNGRGATRYAGALLALSAHWRDWLRPLEDWEPPEADPGAQFGSLVRHLLARYQVPAFLDAAWFAGLTPDGVRQQGWYKHVGRGESPRTADGLPIPLTKRMAHHFLQAPADMGILATFRYAQVLGMGGDERLARSLPETRIGTDFDRDDFWLPVIRWLIAHPGLDRVHHGPVIDYLHDQKFVPSAPNPATRVRGQPRQALLLPLRPNLSMTGRTPESLLRRVAEWHKELGSRRLGMFVRWKSTGIRPLVYEEGEGADRKVYEAVELISAEELEDEGRALGHCVATYWLLCESGQSSIWSLSVEDAAGAVERLLTLEVRSREWRIVQARGKVNRPASAEELRILARWSEAGGPSLSPLIAEMPVEL